MFYRNWFQFLAVIGLGLALAPIAYAQPINGNGGSNTSSSENQAELDADQKPNPPPSIQDILQRIAGALEAANDKPESAEEQARAQRDLQAQEDMAKWAKWMIWIGLGEAFITGIGVFLVWRTLIYTRNAAIHAGASVKEARRATQVALFGAKEARRSVAQAEESNKLLAASHTAESRPWVVIEPALASDILIQHNGRVQFPISVTFKNIGKTPAECVHVLIQSNPYSAPGETLEDFVQVNTRDDARWREKILLPGEADIEVWPQMPGYEAPAEGERFKVNLFRFYVGAFYKTPMMSGYRVTATQYIAAVNILRDGDAISLEKKRVGFSRDKGIVT